MSEHEALRIIAIAILVYGIVVAIGSFLTIVPPQGKASIAFEGYCSCRKWQWVDLTREPVRAAHDVHLQAVTQAIVGEMVDGCERPKCQHRTCDCSHAECGHADENVQPNCADCECSGFTEADV